MIEGVAHVGNAVLPSGCDEHGKGGGACHPSLEITSGGPGSSHKGGGTCCGFTVRLNNEDGTLRMEQETSAKTGEIYCDDHSGNPRPCTSVGNSISGGNPIYNSALPIHIQWVKCGGRYGGSVWYEGRKPISAWSPVTPDVGIKPDSPISSDSTRIRMDATEVKFDTPKVYRNPCSGSGYGYYYYYYGY